MKKSKDMVNKIRMLLKKIFYIKKVWYKIWWVYVIFGIIFLFLIIGIPLIINECYLSKIDDPFITVWEGKDVLLYYGACLTMVGTLLIGVFASVISLKANSINKETVNLQIKDRKAFISIDLNKTFSIYFENKAPLFINKMDNKNVNFTTQYIQDELKGDLIIAEFYLKNISSNYATGVYLNKFEILPEFKNFSAKALFCDADNSNLIYPNESKKVILVIQGLRDYIKESPKDYIGDSCDISLELAIDNLVKEQTKIEIELFLEKTKYNQKDSIKTFKISLNNFQVLQ